MKHKKFILSPISDILQDITSISTGIGDGIENHPLCDYIMQSVFLRMTGAQEQKMKCIFWEIATHDYDYRYSKISQNSFGEYSSYKDKSGIYKELKKQVKSKIKNFEINKTEILNKTNASIQDHLLSSTLVNWQQKKYIDFTEIWNTVSTDHFATNEDLLANKNNLGTSIIKPLREIYEEKLYKQRNRVAHNTLSYQNNLPTLDNLADTSYIYENYFLYFSTLTLIDNIFIQLYKKYTEHIEYNEN